LNFLFISRRHDASVKFLVWQTTQKRESRVTTEIRKRCLDFRHMHPTDVVVVAELVPSSADEMLSSKLEELFWQ